MHPWSNEKRLRSRGLQGGSDGKDQLTLVAANLPRSVFLNRASTPLTAIFFIKRAGPRARSHYPRSAAASRRFGFVRGGRHRGARVVAPTIAQRTEAASCGL